MKTSKSLLIFSLFATSLFLTSSCKKDPTLTEALPEYAKVLLFHGAPSVEGVDLYIDGAKKTSTSLTYGSGSGYVQTDITARKLQTKNTKGVAIDSSILSVKKDVSYSYYVYKDNDAIGSIRVIAKTDALTATTAGKAKVRVVHLLPDVENNKAVDVQIEAVGVLPSNRNDFTALKFKEASDFFELPKGTYELHLKFTGEKNLVIKKSMSITIAEGKIYTFVAHGFTSKVITDPQTAKVSFINNN